MRVHAELLAGVVGLATGVLVASYALMVPADGPLPRPSLSSLIGARPRRAVGVGSLLGCALSAALVGWLRGPWELWALWPAGLLGVGLAIVDVRRRRLPFIAVDAVVSGVWAPAWRALVGCLVALGLFLAVAFTLPGQLGLGDVVLVGWVAMTLGWLGWRPLGTGLLAGLFLQAALAAILIALRRRRVEGGLPMGPALIAGWLIGVASG
jgi:leader peptidase (prepilin peptidase)/N-methyltransferase